MKNISFGIIIILVLLNSACGQNNSTKSFDEGSLDSSIYSSTEIGWTIKIPNGWSIISRDIQQENTKKGLNMIEDAIDKEVDYSGLKQLLSFQINRFNIFQSTSEPYKEETDGEWEENNKTINQIIYETYKNKGIKVDTLSTTEKIDDLDFKLFRIKMYGPDGNIILYQDMYTKLINGFQFAVVLNYNNSIHKEILQKTWRNSKFKRNLF